MSRRRYPARKPEPDIFDTLTFEQLVAVCFAATAIGAVALYAIFWALAAWGRWTGVVS